MYEGLIMMVLIVIWGLVFIVRGKMIYLLLLFVNVGVMFGIFIGLIGFENG